MANQCGKYYRNIADDGQNFHECPQSDTPIGNPVQILKNFSYLLQNLLLIVQKENIAISANQTSSDASKLILVNDRNQIRNQLDESLTTIKQLRHWWQTLSPQERDKFNELPELIQQTQDLALRIISFDKENEQRLLRFGKIPPKYIPRVQTQQPHYVARLYEKQQNFS